MAVVTRAILPFVAAVALIHGAAAANLDVAGEGYESCHELITVTEDHVEGLYSHDSLYEWGFKQWVLGYMTAYSGSRNALDQALWALTVNYCEAHPGSSIAEAAAAVASERLTK